MQEGKEKRMELIDELRSTEALKPEEEKLNKEAKKAARAVQRKQRMMHHKVGIITFYSCEFRLNFFFPSFSV